MTTNQANLIKWGECICGKKDGGMTINQFNPIIVKAHEKSYEFVKKKYALLYTEEFFYQEFKPLIYITGRKGKRGLQLTNIICRESLYKFLRTHWLCEGKGKPISWQAFNDYWDNDNWRGVWNLN